MEQISFGGNKINFRSYECYNWEGQKIKLGKKEYMLLKLLISNRDEVVTRDKIFQSVWGHLIPPISRSIDNYIWRFRKYFEKNPQSPQHFHSVRGLGYKFKY